ncbi:MAG TPA: helix-turn-helix transcriptional regulator [Caulobacteraceae bacterium]
MGLFTPEGIAAALQNIAEAANAEGATLTFSYGAIQIAAITSVGLQEHVAPYLDPDRPFDPRPSRVNPTTAESFRLDQDDFSPEEIARDPFYQEFLRPRGFGWHACALLAGAPGAETVNLTLRRDLHQGMFQPADLAAISTQLPLIRATSAITQMMGGLTSSATAERDARRAMFGFDRNWRAFVVRSPAGADDILRVRAGRLVASDSRQQARVGFAVERARAQSTPTTAMLADPEGAPWILSVVPAAAMAPSWMTPFASWAVLAPCAPPREVDFARAQHIAGLLGLSAAEARVAALIGNARSVTATAQALSTTPGTVRNQLKAIFAKTGVTRQSELVALIARV